MAGGLSTCSRSVSLCLCGWLLVFCVTFVTTAAAVHGAVVNDEPRTDAYYMPGVNIPIEGITLERIAAGRVIYRDARGRRQQRDMQDIGRLRFADLPQLDPAERSFEEGRFRKAIPLLLQSLVQAEKDMQRLWIHARLARAHDIRGEYAQSASHAAAVIMLEEHIVWRDLEPIREPKADPPFAAVVEARHMLHKAQQRITHRDLSQALTRMAERVEQMYEQIQGEHDGPPVESRTTWSGVSIERIRAGDVELDDDDEDDEENRDDEQDAPRTAPLIDEPREREHDRQHDRDRDAETDRHRNDRSPSAIERLLDEGRYAEALDHCLRIERNLAGRDVARFLYHYGRALAGVGQHADAAVMFTRCAILHPTSSDAPRALIETAIIYREHYRQPRTAMRLLDRAEAMLGDDAPADLRNRIARLREQ